MRGKNKLYMNIPRSFFSPDALQEACDRIRGFIPELNNKIIQQIAGKSIQALDAAKNIPRMYRRTNKEVKLFVSSLKVTLIFHFSFYRNYVPA